jgi:hypothetical protein
MSQELNVIGTPSSERKEAITGTKTSESMEIEIGFSSSEEEVDSDAAVARAAKEFMVKDE